MANSAQRVALEVVTAVLCGFIATLDTALPTYCSTIADTVPLTRGRDLERDQAVEVLAEREHGRSETAEGLTWVLRKEEGDGALRGNLKIPESDTQAVLIVECSPHRNRRRPGIRERSGSLLSGLRIRGRIRAHRDGRGPLIGGGISLSVVCQPYGSVCHVGQQG